MATGQYSKVAERGEGALAECVLFIVFDKASEIEKSEKEKSKSEKSKSDAALRDVHTRFREYLLTGRVLVVSTHWVLDSIAAYSLLPPVAPQYSYSLA